VTAFLFRRLAEAVPLMLLLTIAVFGILQALPAGPLSVYENDPSLSPEDVQRLEERFGLSDPLPVRYVKWLGSIVQGDLGYSVSTQRSVSQIIGERLPNTLLLMGCGLLISMLVALPLGVLSALRQYSWIDHAATTVSLVGYAMPPFWTGLMLIIVFSVKFREWGLPALPATGMVTLGADGLLLDRLSHLLLPVTVIALFNASHYARYARASMLEVLQQDFMRTARAKGLSERLIVWRHGLRNAALPVVTVFTLDIPSLFSGAVVTESIFGWPGMGRLFLDAAFRFDYAVLMGVVTITAVLVILSAILADLLYGWIDPRIRFQ
jgi:peptide/nickel transport system permease protein